MRLFLGGLHHSAADSDALIHTFVRPDSGPRNRRLGQGNGNGNGAVIAPLSRRDQNSALVMTVENFADGSVFEHRVDRIGDDAGNRKLAHKEGLKACMIADYVKHMPEHQR